MSSPAPPPPPPPSAAAAPSAALPATPISVQQPPPQPKPPPPAASSPPPPPQQPPPPPAPPQQRPRICFNAHCKDPKSEGPRRRGWRLRSGDFAELCDRCYVSFEQGSFCETFHSEVAGWRTCEACGKKLHCGCIVSVHAYVLLDAGGVDCILCARKSHAAMAPGQTWPSSVHMPQNVADRKDSFVKSWRPPAGQFSSQWRQTNLWSVSSIQSDLQQRLAYEFDRPSGSEKLLPGRTFIHAQEKKFDDMHDRPTTPAGMNQIIRDRYANGHGQHASLDPTYSYTLYHREGSNPNSLHDPSHHGGENDPLSSRKGVIPDPCSSVSAGFKLDSHHPSILKDDPPTLPVGLPANFASANGPKDHIRIAPAQQQSQLASSSLQKQFYSHSVIDNDFQAQMRHGRPRMDAKARSQLLPRYWPRITDQELQHLSGDSNSVITPLFEKMLSASDAGRIGRLVLPKKCAEAYFPPISQPEGLPLKVQDASGKEWVFQFRFWPNNNSRMYVLEGVTPCIQSMQLQAGDTVTFSRIDPEGKLVMGFRKATNLSAEQEQPIKPVNGGPTSSEVNGKVPAPDSSPNAAVPRPNKVNIESKSPSPVEQTAASKMDKGGLAQKEGPGTARSSPGPIKRKATSVGPKIKRLRMDNEESMELKITWEEAQELLRPPLKAPLIVIVDGHEFEEYEEPPILGRRTYFVTDQSGENHQWAQCEDCSKWRKLPVDALLPSKWTCSDNKWDPERTSCASAQEISVEELAELIPIKAGAAKKSKAKIETDRQTPKPSSPSSLRPRLRLESFTMIISKKNRREICKYLFQEGVLYAKKDYNLAKHPKVDVPNLEVIKLMQSFKSKEYVRETFSWQHYYWYLTNDGIEHLRTFLNLPSEIVPNTLKKSSKPPSRPFGSGPPGDRPRGPPRFDGDRPRFGDRDGYRGGPRGAPGDFGGEKGGAPAEFQPSFRGSRPGFGRGGGGAFGGGASSME